METLACQLSSTLMQLLFSFDQDMRVEKTLIQTLASQLSSTLMQLLYSFDQGMRVEKTLIQTLACQLSSTLIQTATRLILAVIVNTTEFLPALTKRAAHSSVGTPLKSDSEVMQRLAKTGFPVSFNTSIAHSASSQI